ncbi:histidine phosphatase family protein [Nisaea acidiphila]|uniref:Histidine phosphatase family protein n=1 Tax=Nisaea acidiphila TaxID=1862145 RepID=A0A9J7AUF6_9PROT|nr:histidine phosphatase family protein [Nisaea acidiphila]UUX50458.1 histidine phosphatase family protein [Nisaea acidiphila]
MTRIYLIRHGETIWNREGRLQGQLDSPLTLHGIRQAEANGRKFAEISARESLSLHASPLGRTRQTAAIICELSGLPYEEIRFDARLKEITLGEHDGYRGWERLDRDFPELAAQRRADPWHFQHPGGESTEMVRRRLAPFLGELQEKGGAHLIVAHGVVNKVLRGIYLGLSEEECFALDRRQDGFHLLEDGAERFVATEPAPD